MSRRPHLITALALCALPLAACSTSPVEEPSAQSSAAAPTSSATDSTSRTDRSPAPSSGVTAHGRPSNSRPDAAIGPDRSLPAIGWLPT